MRCACGAEATANGKECQRCYLDRLRGLNWHYAPSKSKGAIDPDKQKQWDSRLEDYRKVRAEGSQPPGTKRSDIELTKKLSDQLGAPFKAAG